MNDRNEDREALKDKTSREDKAERRLGLRCSYCPPNKGENAKRKPKRGVRKPRKKDYR